jgi:hypothetical protein
MHFSAGVPGARKRAPGAPKRAPGRPGWNAGAAQYCTVRPSTHYITANFCILQYSTVISALTNALLRWRPRRAKTRAWPTWLEHRCSTVLRSTLHTTVHYCAVLYCSARYCNLRPDQCISALASEARQNARPARQNARLADLAGTPVQHNTAQHATQHISAQYCIVLYSTVVCAMISAFLCWRPRRAPGAPKRAPGRPGWSAGAAQCCAVLYTVQYWAILYCAILYSTVVCALINAFLRWRPRRAKTRARRAKTRAWPTWLECRCSTALRSTLHTTLLRTSVSYSTVICALTNAFLHWRPRRAKTRARRAKTRA